MTATRLPGRSDGADGLLQLAKTFGDEAVYDLILLCRTARNREEDAGGAALVALGNQLVAAEMDRANVDYDTARQNVGKRLGYGPTTLTNFYKILTGGRAPEKRPHSSTRGKESK